MIDCHLDPVTAVLTVHPESAFSKSDFAAIAKVVDPQIEQRGGPTGWGRPETG